MMDVMLKIVGMQQFQDEEPDVTELLTEGTMWQEDGAVYLSYAESELTGMSGTKTTFRIEPSRVVLTRSGAIQSKMVFVAGEGDRSLYHVGFGVLMIAIHTDRVESSFNERGGRLRVAYSVTVEDGATGSVRYTVTASPK